MSVATIATNGVGKLNIRLWYLGDITFFIGTSACTTQQMLFSGPLSEIAIEMKLRLRTLSSFTFGGSRLCFLDPEGLYIP